MHVSDQKRCEDNQIQQIVYFIRFNIINTWQSIIGNLLFLQETGYYLIKLLFKTLTLLLHQTLLHLYYGSHFRSKTTYR